MARANQIPRRGKGAAVQWVRDHVNYNGPDCLPWPFCRVGGYGNFGYEGGNLYAHRYMCELVNGPPPSPKHHAAHSCGKGHEGCVHPKHLSWKTARENQLDRRQHGTQNVGYGPRGKLTPAERDWIVLLQGKATQEELAVLFGVARGTVQYWHRNAKKKAPAL